jgi:riboflavin synthase
MFTGLIQGLGQLNPLGGDRLEIRFLSLGASFPWDSINRGDSIAVDGVCLTVELGSREGFVATVSPETLRRSTLGRASQRGIPVNLEPSLRAGDKLGGHFVTGHVDGVGTLVEIVATAQAWELTFSLTTAGFNQAHQNISRYLVTKGSIAVNGISLTIADCQYQQEYFRVAVIPHTYQNTNLCHLQAGDWVNLEADILGKYVERLLDSHHTVAPEVSFSFLREQGY